MMRCAPSLSPLSSHRTQSPFGRKCKADEGGKAARNGGGERNGRRKRSGLDRDGPLPAEKGRGQQQLLSERPRTKRRRQFNTGRRSERTAGREVTRSYEGKEEKTIGGRYRDRNQCGVHGERKKRRGASQERNDGRRGSSWEKKLRRRRISSLS